MVRTPQRLHEHLVGHWRRAAGDEQAGHRIVFQFDAAITSAGTPSAVDASGNPIGTLSTSISGNNVTVAVGTDGRVHVAYRQRNESRNPPLFSPTIDTYYQESRDGGKTWSDPLKVNSEPSRPWYGAFSRNGTFEGDYEETASSGGYTYVVREQGAAASPGERQALTATVPPPPLSNDNLPNLTKGWFTFGWVAGPVLCTSTRTSLAASAMRWPRIARPTSSWSYSRARRWRPKAGGFSSWSYGAAFHLP